VKVRWTPDAEQERHNVFDFIARASGTLALT
jgi:plasmid stabilization system protein ParE